jgi:hypothetical protein
VEARPPQPPPQGRHHPPGRVVGKEPADGLALHGPGPEPSR